MRHSSFMLPLALTNEPEGKPLGSIKSFSPSLGTWFISLGTEYIKYYWV